MVLLITGLFLILMGLFSGSILVAAPLGLVNLSPTITLWVLFPLFSIAGYVLFLIAAKTAHIRGLSMLVSSFLLLLALSAAGGLVLSAASIMQAANNTIALWYVLAVAGTLGVSGVATNRTTPQETS